MGECLLAVYFVNLGLINGAYWLTNGAEGLAVGAEGLKNTAYGSKVGVDGLTDVCDGLAFSLTLADACYGLIVCLPLADAWDGWPFKASKGTCNTAKIWQRKEDESIDSAFARFNTIITSLKALDEVKAKAERKSLALNAKKESSDEECLTFGSEDEEYTMAVRDFKKFFKRRGRFVRQPQNNKKTFQRSCDDKNDKSDRKYFRCDDPNHLIGKCPNPPKDKNQRAFVGGSWSDSGKEDDEKVNNKTCLVAQASKDESIDSAFARFNTIITSLKALDEVKAKAERKSLALNAKKESSDEECLTFGSEDEEYTMAVRDFKKFFKRRGRFVRQPQNNKKTFQRSCDDKNDKSDRKYFRCDDPNHLIGKCPNPPKDKNQRAFVGGSWSDSGKEDDEKVNNKTCLVAQASSEAKKESSDQEYSTSGSEDEEYTMAVRDFKKFFRRRDEDQTIIFDDQLLTVGVIITGDSPAPTVVIDGVVRPVTILFADQNLARRNELKACGTLLMALLDKHQLKFNSHKDAKTLLPSEWKTHTLIWRNKANLEEHSLDDLFNSLKIYEAEVKHSSTPGNSTQNLAFVSSSNTDSTTDSIDVDDLEEMDVRWQMAMLTMRARRFLQKTGRNLGDNRITTIGFDMSKVKCYNCHRKGHLARECRSLKDTKRTGAAEPQRRTALVENFTSNALVSQCDGIGSYDWSYQAEEEPKHDKHSLGYILESNSKSLSPSSLSDRIQPSGGYNDVPLLITGNFMPPKPDLVFHTAHIAVETDHLAFTVQLCPAKPAQNLSHATRPMAPIIEDWVSDSKDESESVDHLVKDFNFLAKPKTQPTQRNYTHRGYNKQHASFTKNHHKKHIVPVAVLTKSKPVSVTVVRPVSAVVPKIMVTRPRHVHSLNTKSNSTIRRHKTRSQSLKTSNSSQKVTAAKAHVVSAVKGKKGK
nr:hypothetical protein [Tanacetum cinerariifolium]